MHLLCADNLAVRPWRMALDPAGGLRIGRHLIEPEPGPGEPRRALAQLSLSDPHVAPHHARLDCAAGGGWQLTDDGSGSGTRLDGRQLPPGEPAAVRDGALIEIGHTFFLFRLPGQGSAARSLDVGATGRGDPQTLCPAWEDQLRMIDRLARSSQPVLIEGESGVGKELLACSLHERSGRRGALVSLNCGALPDNLLEDELFGHVRGAFSGALTSRDGLIRAANGGTLFLDEVGDMPASLQTRLLRVLENHRVRPLGSEAEIAVDVRVVAATHRDLKALVRAGTFRHDLLARLGLWPFRVPALRERREDLGLLIRALLGPAPNGLGQVWFEVDALRALLQYRWPLNVRELRAALLSAADLARDEDGTAVIGLAHLPASLRSGGAGEPTASPGPTASSEPVEPVEPAEASGPAPAALDDDALRDRLIELLAVHRGNVAAVARALGNKRTNVQRLLARLGIDRRAAASSGPVAHTAASGRVTRRAAG
ncbi:MAG TPA: sigma 54-interacting transcriptional regulator [Kofleriaceae bacterium]|nr:sigma 54-interacting transcriptional regulator [Kofleriaceae bacterium]